MPAAILEAAGKESEAAAVRKRAEGLAGQRGELLAYRKVVDERMSSRRRRWWQRYRLALVAIAAVALAFVERRARRLEREKAKTPIESADD